MSQRKPNQGLYLSQHVCGVTFILLHFGSFHPFTCVGFMKTVFHMFALPRHTFTYVPQETIMDITNFLNNYNFPLHLLPPTTTTSFSQWLAIADSFPGKRGILYPLPRLPCWDLCRSFDCVYMYVISLCMYVSLAIYGKCSFPGYFVF